ncbi:MAG: MBL fold metallo-hydrolase [Bacteroidales bacterium]|nr:MBL fold metallo-hydrolase [Bacteroidales bacterium]
MNILNTFLSDKKTKKALNVILSIISVILGILILINIFVYFAPQFGRNPDKVRMTKLAKNARYEKGRFLNEKDVPVLLPKSQTRMIGMWFKKVEERSPEYSLPSIMPDFSSTLADSLISITWLGHSSVYIRMGGLTVLTDPVFSKRVSPVPFAGPKPFRYTHKFSPENLPVPDIILISHDHFDHLDYQAVREYNHKVKLFIVPLGVRDHLERWGIKPEQILEMDWWQEESVLGKLSVTATPSQHFSGRQNQGNKTLWSSWVIGYGDEKVFFSGDSGYADHFKRIGEKLGPFRIALIECGAYGEYWPNIHMVPEQSVQAALDLNAEVALPVHWAKYSLAFHPWKEPIRRFTFEADRIGLQYVTPLIGQEFFLSDSLPKTKWWEN